MPTSFTPINFQVTATITSQDHEMIITANGSGVTSDSARFRRWPRLRERPPFRRSPRVHLFGKPASPASDTPFLAVVVEYNENLFRHMYLGCMEKIGNYTGGEVIATVSGPLAAQATDMAFNDTSTQNIFSTPDPACGRPQRAAACVLRMRTIRTPGGSFRATAPARSATFLRTPCWADSVTA